jgi:hypothetical protein
MTPAHFTIREMPIPQDVGTVVAIAPVELPDRSTWILLTREGAVIRFDTETGELARLATVTVPEEPDHEPWVGHVLTRRLYVSDGGEFAAVVNDFGHFGQIIDLRTGDVTLSLNGGDYYPETVPFSFAFTRLRGRVFAIHRTDWNRLDVSDPATGELLTSRHPTSYSHDEERPEQYLDYFHGGLYVSPDGTRIIDDGWVWHPVGVPTTWSLEQWLFENVWESENGASKKDICARNYYWNHAVAWLDDRRVAVAGIGDDDEGMIEGARIFDVTQPGTAGGEWRTDWTWARELTSFPGPAGLFFSDGRCLFSSDATGLSRWDIETGIRTGHRPGFQPTRYQRAAGEFGQLTDSALVLCKITD